jgi:hypothetical protein
MNKLYITLSLSLIVLVLIRIYGQSVLGFTDIKNEGFYSSSSKELLICKMQGCGHCVKAAPEFDKLQKASPLKLDDGSSVTVRILDASTDKDELNSLGVNGFPTILYKVNGNYIPYEKPTRTYDGVMAFLNSQ